MSNLHQKIIELVAAPENRDEVAGACMTMRADGSWAITIVTKPRGEPEPATFGQIIPGITPNDPSPNDPAWSGVGVKFTTDTTVFPQNAGAPADDSYIEDATTRADTQVPRRGSD